MEIRRFNKSEKGAVLVLVIICAFILSIMGFSLLSLAKTEIVLTKKDVNKTKAFYLAEAGLALLPTRLLNKEFENIEGTALGEGSYWVDVYCDEDPPYAVSSGKVGNEQKSIKVQLSFLAPPFEHAVYGNNLSGQKFIFTLRGQGIPKNVPLGGEWTGWGSTTREIGGKDAINGNIFVDGDIALYEESSINPAPLPNTYGLAGDVDATGNIDILDSASISGATQQGVPPPDGPDLLGMNYPINNTHNVSQLFADEGVGSGRLPSGHELYDVVEKNPSDRANECATTAGDDYFLEPESITGAGTAKGAKTPLHLGDDRIYYIDGNVWVHSPQTYGFLLDGKATIVATGNIYICDNTKYADSESMLGLVALGTHNGDGQLVSGGNVYFGDPRFGTLYTFSAFMFAANNFLYNTDSVTGGAEEPETGFSVYGNLSALNQVFIQRDWYFDDVTGDPRPAYFDTGTGQWVDVENEAALTSGEIDSIRHYQMQITYDERVRTVDTQPPGLPKGNGTIFAGLIQWEELAY